jgi:hypothetical protein
MKQKRKRKSVLQDYLYIQDAYGSNFIDGLRNSTAIKVAGDNYNWSTFMTATITIAAATFVNVY